MNIMETLEKAQAQTWWLPETATIYEGADFCYYRLGEKYFIVRFSPNDDDIENTFAHILHTVGGEPLRFVYMPHRHNSLILEHVLRLGFVRNNRYEARAIHVDHYERSSSPRFQVVMVQTLEEMKQVYEVRRKVFASTVSEPVENLQRFLRDATGPNARVRQFLVLDTETGEPVSQAGMSLFPDLGFAFLFAGGTVEEARGLGAYTSSVAARVAYAKSIGIAHVGLFAREDTSSPIVARQGFDVYGEMQDWNLNF